MKIPTTALVAHQSFISNALPHLAADPRLIGVAAAGSWAENSMDEFSDLDLMIAVEPEHLDQIMSERQNLAASLGTLLTAFTGVQRGRSSLLEVRQALGQVPHLSRKVTLVIGLFRVCPQCQKARESFAKCLVRDPSHLAPWNPY